MSVSEEVSFYGDEPLGEKPSLRSPLAAMPSWRSTPESPLLRPRKRRNSRPSSESEPKRQRGPQSLGPADLDEDELNLILGPGAISNGVGPHGDGARASSPWAPSPTQDVPLTGDSLFSSVACSPALSTLSGLSGEAIRECSSSQPSSSQTIYYGDSSSEEEEDTPRSLSARAAPTRSGRVRRALHFYPEHEYLAPSMWDVED
eukprot:maker-scaffold1137_size60140-snap-gene-0.20 protein:Tk10575 transcript:maker-scaffold1137_size60140-snap-gene-0.20-mRNA-1 annotation:"udp-n-acetylmuramoylalanine--d-glutamate ligase"